MSDDRPAVRRLRDWVTRHFGADPVPDPEAVIVGARVRLEDSQLIVRQLDLAGIPAYAVDEVRSSGMGSWSLAPMARIYLRELDVEAATPIIDGHRSDTAALLRDEEQEEEQEEEDEGSPGV